MLRVAICDDEKLLCCKIEDIVLSMKEVLYEQIEVDVFFSGEALYKYLKQSNYFDIIFLDIQLQMMNGIELGRLIRDELNNETTQIIYISAQESYAMDLFDIRPLNFLIKPLQKEKIEEVVLKACKLAGIGCHNFKYQIGHIIYVEPVKKILYFESENRRIRMVTIDGVKIFYGKLIEIYEQLVNYKFFYIHKSFLVNYNQIIATEYHQITMSNKEVLPISQSKRKQVRALQMKFERED